MDGVVYAVTAAHVVFSKREILDHPFLYRGYRGETYIDVAFLKVNQGSYMNTLATSLDPTIYEDYWTSTFQPLTDEFGVFFPPEHFPPGTEIEKVGIGSGVTKGLLLDTVADTVFASPVGEEDGEQKTRMIAVRWLPNRPFTTGNDSGSVYYATHGCVRLPIAIHCGASSLQGNHPKAGFWFSIVDQGRKVKKYVTLTNEPASFGTRLADAYEWWESVHEFQGSPEWLPLFR